MLTRTSRSGSRGHGRLRHLVSHEDLVADAFHAPARDGVEGRRTQRLAGFEAETGVVPGASNRVAHDEAFGKRTVVVRAMRADREQSIAGARQKNLILPDLPEDHAPIGNGVGLYATRQVPGCVGSRVSHDYLPLGTHFTPGARSQGSPTKGCLASSEPNRAGQLARERERVLITLTADNYGSTVVAPRTFFRSRTLAVEVRYCDWACSVSYRSVGLVEVAHQSGQLAIGSSVAAA